MKTLKDYIIEANDDKDQNNSTTTTTEAPDIPESQMFTLDFNELEGADDIIKQLEGKDNIEIADKKVVITVKRDEEFCPECLELLNKYASDLRKESRNATYESYAQLTKRFANTVGELNKYIDEIKDAK